MFFNEYVAVQLHKTREASEKTKHVNSAVTEVINEFKAQERINKRKPRR